MYSTFDIIVFHKDLTLINMEEIFAEWGGEIFSRDPKKYNYYNKLFFNEWDGGKQYMFKLLQTKFTINDDVMVLSLEGSELTQLEIDVNKNNPIDYNYIIKLIKEMFKKLNQFYIVKELEDEKISKKVKTRDEKKAMKVFIDSFDWESPGGVIISKNLNVKDLN